MSLARAATALRRFIRLFRLAASRIATSRVRDRLLLGRGRMPLGIRLGNEPTRFRATVPCMTLFLGHDKHHFCMHQNIIYLHVVASNQYTHVMPQYVVLVIRRPRIYGGEISIHRLADFLQFDPSAYEEWVAGSQKSDSRIQDPLL